MSNNKVLTDINRAKQVIDNNFKHPNEEDPTCPHFFKLYSFTNENLSGYLRNHTFTNSTSLTVGSSTDQALNLIYHGSHNITILDINPFVKYYYDLKKAAILKLNRDEFLSFFCNQLTLFLKQSSHTFNEDIYYKLSKYLPRDSQMFWNSLFNSYSPHFIKRYFFMPEELSKTNLIKNNDYLLDNNFNIMRPHLEKTNIKFLENDILNINDLNQKYDNILLSNVLDYLFNYYLIKTPDNKFELEIANAHEYLNFINQVINHLNVNGTLFFHYMWDIYNLGYKYYHTLDKLIANKDNCEKIIYEGSHHFKDERDSIYIYTKKL